MNHVRTEQNDYTVTFRTDAITQKGINRYAYERQNTEQVDTVGQQVT